MSCRPAYAPPMAAEPTTVAGLDAWTWRIDEPDEEVHAYLVEIPASGDQPATQLVVVVAGTAIEDVPGIVAELGDG